MQAGRLRHRVTIQNYTTTRDSFNQAIKTWADLVTVWGKVTMAGGQERYVVGADQSVATVTHRINLRRRADVQLSPTLHRIKWQGRFFDIEAVLDPDGRSREVLLLCREVVGEPEP